MAGEYAALVLLAAVSAAGLPGPGDSALIAAGLLAAEGHLRLSVVLVVAFLGCLGGRSLGYWLGSAGGRPLMERPGPFHAFRCRTIEKGDHLFERFPRLAPLLAPAVLSGIYRVTVPAFAVASVLAATWWTLATVLGAYVLGPPAADILHDIGVRGVLGILIIAAVGLLYRYLAQRRNPPQTEHEHHSGPRVARPPADSRSE